jgi:ATP-dependent helicase/nuclease subunit A
VVNLSQNFRSVEGILDWVNRIFEQLIGVGDGDAQPSYHALHPHRTSLDAGRDVVLLGGPARAPAAEVRMAEAREIAQAIAALRAAHHQVVDDRPGAPPDACRPMRHDDVAILVPTRAPVGAIERALDDTDIPYRIESRSLVWRTDAVREILAILTAIEDPADEVAVVAALRSPAFACTDAELLAWRRAGGRWDHTRRQPEELAAGHPVREAMATLRRWHEERHWQPVDAIVDRVVGERRLIELTMAQRRPRDHWRRLRFVADQARAFVESGGASLAQFLAWAELQTDEGATAVETVVPEPDDDAVRILTVHGAKGLEFPVVVLAGLATSRPPSLIDVAWLDDGPEVMVTALGGGRFATGNWGDASDAAKRFEAAEAKRLLYVAATRARDTLIVSLHHAEHADRESHAKRLYPLAVESQVSWVPGDVEAPPLYGTVEGPPPRSAGERAAWLTCHEAALAAARRGWSVSPTGLARLVTAPPEQLDLFDGAPAGDDADAGVEEVDDDSAAPEPTVVVSDDGVEAPAVTAHRGGSAVGRAVHAVLETVPLDGAAPVDPSTVATLAARFAADESVDEATVVELAASALASEALAEARAAGRLWREVPVVVPMGDRILEGFIDLLYERPGGELVVVDWKTDRGRSAAEVAAALDRYRLQGAGYAAAVEAATGRPVAEVRFVFCRAGGQPAVERTIDDLAGAVTEVATLLQ